MKRNLLSCLSLFILTNVGICQRTYSALKYDSLVIYDFDWRGAGKRHLSIIDENDRLPPTIKKSVALSGKEAKELTAKIESSDSYGQITAACFDPHFGMVYYKNGRPIGHITVCIGCNFLRSDLDIPARNQGAEILDGETFYTRSGFSTNFRKYLSALKRKHGFSHHSIESDIFDKE